MELYLEVTLLVAFNSTLEKAFAIGILAPGGRRFQSTESLGELKSLIETSGLNLIHEQMAEVRDIHPATFIGRGKQEEIGRLIADLQPQVVLMDTELSPIQHRNLEKMWEVRVMDRTGIILDIFAQRAKSKEGKLQVELAQYQYLLPRLTRLWTHLSKQRGGGVGLRGPGETQLEVDRRRARERITQIKKNLERVSLSRHIHRQNRQAVPIPTVSLVGYTNAGKSTLFNALVRAGELAEDKLFATLDPKTKKLRLPSGRMILLSDTVGFIRNLPHELVESFKSTFEEVADADVLLHVMDASHDSRDQQEFTVKKVLSDLQLSHKPVIEVYNKIDRSPMDRPGGIAVSGLTGEGLPALLLEIETVLARFDQRVRLFIPHGDGRALSDVYTHGTVLSREFCADGATVEVNLSAKWHNMYQKYACVE